MREWGGGGLVSSMARHDCGHCAGTSHAGYGGQRWRWEPSGRSSQRDLLGADAVAVVIVQPPTPVNVVVQGRRGKWYRRVSEQSVSPRSSRVVLQDYPASTGVHLSAIRIA
jgi:hypothetical protein